MKVLQNSAHNGQLKGNTIQGYNNQQILQTPFRANNDRYLDSDRYQFDSISSSKKPIIELDVQISHQMSSKMVVFEDSVPEILVEDFIAQNSMKPQAFNPILKLVLENMKKAEESRKIIFSNLRDDESYEILMKKQLALCQEYQQTKELLRLEKLRGELLVNNSKIKVGQNPFGSQKIPNSPPQRDQEENKPIKRSFTPAREANITQVVPISKTPRQRTEITDNLPQQRNKSADKKITQHQEPNKKKQAEGNQPLLFFYDHLNPQNQLSKSQEKGRAAKPTKNIQNSQRQEVPRNQFKYRNASPLQVQVQQVKKSPLKYSNEETYSEKGERKRNYLKDTKNVTERLHNSGKNQNFCTKEHHSQDKTDKECTFKPKINNNSDQLSKLYYQRRVTPQPTPFEEENPPFNTTYKVKSLSEIVQLSDKGSESKKDQPFAQRNIDHSMQTSDIEREIGIQTSNSLNRQINNTPIVRESTPLGNQQFTSQFPSSPNQNLRYFNRYEESERSKEESKQISQQTMGVQTSQSLNPQQVESTQTYQNPIRVMGVQTSRSLNPNQPMAVQTSSSLNPTQSAGIQAIAPTKTAFMQTFSIVQQSLGIQTSQGLNPKVQAGVQTQEEQILKRSQANQTSQVIVPKLSASIQTSDNFQRERVSACAQTSQSFKASKHSMAMQTSEQEQESSFREQNDNKVDFDPHLNKNYFKFLQMQDDMAQENNNNNPLFDQEIHYSQQAKQSLSQYLPQQQYEQPPIKQSAEVQTSDWLLDNNNPSVKSSSNHSQGPVNQVPFDPHMNKNYFKFLQMEEEKENEKTNPNHQLNYSLSAYGNQSPSMNQQYGYSNNEEVKPNLNSQTEQSFSNPHQSQYIQPVDQGIQNQRNQQSIPKPLESNQNTQNQGSSHYLPNAQGNDNLTEPNGVTDPTTEKESVYYQQEGSVYYCDEDAMILQSDHPFGSLGGSNQPRVNNHQILKSHGKISTSSQSEQKPDTAISCVRSVSPRIDTNAKPSALILSQQQVVVSISTPRLAGQPNQFRQDNPFMVQSNSNQILFQSKLRGKLSEEEQEALVAVFQELKNSTKDKTILRKHDIDTDQLKFGVVLRSHLEIIMRQFQPNEEITLESFFRAAEKSNSLSLFLSECQDFLNQMKAGGE